MFHFFIFPSLSLYLTHSLYIALKIIRNMDELKYTECFLRRWIIKHFSFSFSFSLFLDVTIFTITSLIQQSYHIERQNNFGKKNMDEENELFQNCVFFLLFINCYDLKRCAFNINFFSFCLFKMHKIVFISI